MWEGNINQFPPIGAPTQDQSGNLGMCPDRNSTRNLVVSNQPSHVGIGWKHLFKRGNTTDENFMNKM